MRPGPWNIKRLTFPPKNFFLKHTFATNLHRSFMGYFGYLFSPWPRLWEANFIQSIVAPSLAAAPFLGLTYRRLNLVSLEQFSNYCFFMRTSSFPPCNIPTSGTFSSTHRAIPWPSHLLVNSAVLICAFLTIASVRTKDLS